METPFGSLSNHESVLNDSVQAADSTGAEGLVASEENMIPVLELQPSTCAIFVHAWLTNHWRKIVNEQFVQIGACGLASEAEITVGAIGDPGPLNELSAVCSSAQAKLLTFGNDPAQFEFPTLERLRVYAESHEGYVCYLHTKGVSQPTVPLHDYWRRTMMDFVVVRWRECVAALHAGASVAGVRWRSTKREWPHIFAGNFWWARCDYVRALPGFNRSTRYGAEDWILSGHPRRIFEHRVPKPLI